MTKRYQGRRPEGILIAELDGGWELWNRNRGSNGWTSLKLVFAKGREKKANYYLGWKADECRLARNHDAGILYENLPNLYAQVLACLGERFGTPSLANA
jgi:hypothetical protein